MISLVSVMLVLISTLAMCLNKMSSLPVKEKNLAEVQEDVIHNRHEALGWPQGMLEEAGKTPEGS